MGFLSTVLGLFLGGYLLGIGTARTVLHHSQSAYEEGAPEIVAKPTLLPNPTYVRIPVRSR